MAKLLRYVQVVLLGVTTVRFLRITGITKPVDRIDWGDVAWTAGLFFQTVWDMRNK